MTPLAMKLEQLPIDRARLARSLRLAGVKVGEGRYRVEGGREAHWVDLYTSSIPRCDCADHLWREAVCKHILAALVREGHERVIREIGGLFAALTDHRTAA